MNSRYIVPSVDGTFFLDYTNLQVSACSVPQLLQIFWKAVITRMESEQELYRNTAPIHPQLLLTLMQQSKISFQHEDQTQRILDLFLMKPLSLGNVPKITKPLSESDFHKLNTVLWYFHITKIRSVKDRLFLFPKILTTVSCNSQLLFWRILRLNCQ